ncbi:Na+/H+ antiporter NhaA [Parasphingorhabdus sp.]|uniref:Na+/H+ antiporter NhaA n=1 Tax=Parasphingorhabdus sp. TaxID=2709688 RepID=UPI002F925E34
MSSETQARSSSDSALRKFLKSEASGGILLMLAAALAMIVANSPLYDLYHHFLHELKGPVISEKLGPMTPHLWINDGLMAIFFLLVGLEIKREFVDGRLNTWERRRLPVLAAAAGMVVPALVYLLFVRDMPELYNGWAIPAATDIAFAIGVLALLGPRAPTSLKLFLITVAIVDDMGAVAIIALVYTAEINGAALLASAVILGIMYIMNKAGVRSLIIYLFFALLLWFAVLLSGVHATIAGVLAAMAIPIVVTPGSPDSAVSPLHRLEHKIAPWSAFFIIPLFGFANAGVSLEGIGLEHIFAPLPIGIAAGLFFGKQIGIFSAVWIAVKTGFAGSLGGASWLQVYGVSMLCGIGFTMSLFIGALAFPGNVLLIEEAKIGVLGGSFLSAVLGYAILRFAPQHTHLEALDEDEERELKAVM